MRVANSPVLHGSPQNPPNWFSRIRNHIARGLPREALVTYTRIRHKRIDFLGVAPLLFKACASLALLNFGKSLHAVSIKAGVDSNVLVGTSLLDMYAKCGHLVTARKKFDEMPNKNVVTWNAMIGGYMRCGDTEMACFLFDNMSTRSTVTWNEMIDGFARKGDSAMARWIFDQVPWDVRNVVTWTVMVDGYASNGEMEAARKVFEDMPQQNFYVWSSMISGYFRRGDLKEAKAIFDQVPARNLVIWNSLISGYAQNGLCEEALEAFGKMQAEGFEADEVTIASALSACAQLGLLDAGREIHKMIDHKGIHLNQFVLNALVDMYAKCGDLATARVIFKRMQIKNNAVWNSMISGFAIHGYGKEAVKFFEKMENDNGNPDDITFLSVLSACVHGGLVDKGLEIFSKMESYGLAASTKHYGCLVDLLSRAGRLTDALDLIKRMPVQPNDAVWGALLGACRIYMDLEMAERVVKEIGTLNSNRGSGDDSFHALLSNIYTTSEWWEKAEQTRAYMGDKGFSKTPGCSTVILERV